MKHAASHPMAGSYVRLDMPDAPQAAAQVIDWADRVGWWLQRLSAAATSRQALEDLWDEHPEQVVLARIGTTAILVDASEIGTEPVSWTPLEGVETE